MTPPEFEASIRRAGLRVTRQRLAVLEALAQRPGAVTAQQLHHEMRAAGSSPGLSTIYRTLTALAQSGSLDLFHQDNEQAFRLCGDQHHHHLVCRGCGLVQEVDGAEVEAWVERVARKSGFEVAEHFADVYGLCSTCR